MHACVLFSLRQGVRLIKGHGRKSDDAYWFNTKQIVLSKLNATEALLRYCGVRNAVPGIEYEKRIACVTNQLHYSACMRWRASPSTRHTRLAPLTSAAGPDGHDRFGFDLEFKLRAEGNPLFWSPVLQLSGASIWETKRGWFVFTIRERFLLTVL